MSRKNTLIKKNSLKKKIKGSTKTLKKKNIKNKNKMLGKDDMSPQNINNLSLKPSINQTSFRGFGEDIIMGLLYLLEAL